MTLHGNKKIRREFEYLGYLVRIDAIPRGYSALIFEDITEPAITQITRAHDNSGFRPIIEDAKRHIDLLMKK